MASITKSTDGKTRVMFVTPDGSRRTIYLGTIDQKSASNMARHVEHLLTAREHDEAPPADTTRYLSRLSDALFGKLSRVGLVEPRSGSRTLAAFVDRAIDQKTLEGLKPASIRRLKLAGSKLTDFFGSDCRMRDIEPSRASEWRASMLQAGKSLAFAKGMTSDAKTLARMAERDKLWPQGNPFAHLLGGVTRTSYERYVDADEAGRVVEGLRATDASAESILYFGLCRFAGLRAPSETHLLTWGDIDWSRGTINVRSPKTERYRGHESRTVPIDARLLPLLQSRFDEAEPGASKLVTRDKRRFKKELARACQRSGVEFWHPITKILRSSCERDLAERGVPQSDLSRLMGHSILVSERHYLSREVSAKTLSLLATTSPTPLNQDDAKSNAKRDAESDAARAGMGRNGVEMVRWALPAEDAKHPDFSDAFVTMRDDAISTNIGLAGFEPTTF